MHSSEYMFIINPEMEEIKEIKFSEIARSIIHKRTDYCYCCGKEKVKFFRCSKCGYVQYCSKQCQINSWKTIHKIQCSIHIKFDPENAVHELLKRKDLQNALDMYSRFAPRIRMYEGKRVLIYFHLICINLFGGEQKRSGIYMIMKRGPMEFVKDLPEIYNDIGITKDRMKDIFLVRFSFYMREDTNIKGIGCYYFIDMLEKAAYIPEKEGIEAISQIKDIQYHCQIFGNVVINDSCFDLLTANDNNKGVFCSDAETYIFKHQAHSSLHHIFDEPDPLVTLSEISSKPHK